jgi:hypothetical protein
MEVNVNPKGLDENYPFAMTEEHAKQCYNLRKEEDGCVYFGYDPYYYLPLTFNKTVYLPTNRLDQSEISNRQEKLMMYYSHFSDELTDMNKSMSKSYKSIPSFNKGTSEDTSVVQSIDFLIPPKATENDKSIKGRHFRIKYHLKGNNYTVKDLGVGYGVFAGIEKPILLQDSLLINICQTYIVVNLSYDIPTQYDDKPEESETVPSLKLKVFGGSAQGEEYLFNESDKNKILIGRSEI